MGLPEARAGPMPGT